MLHPFRSSIAGLLLLVATSSAHAQSVAQVRAHAAEWERLIAAEDARARTPEQLQQLLDGLRSPVPVLRAIAVRGVGRLERANLLDRITPLLRDSAARVRAEAAHAYGQAVSRETSAPSRTALIAAIEAERNADALAAMLETLGRVRHTDEESARATIAVLLPRLEGEPAVAHGAVRGLHFLVRQQPARAAVANDATAALKSLALQRTAPEPTGTRLRRAAIATLILAGRHDAELMRSALNDADAYVRREAALGLNTTTDTAALRELLPRVLADQAGAVRYEGMRIYGRRLVRQGCAPIEAATRDANAHVALLAIDMLRNACPQDASLTDRLVALARVRNSDGDWHTTAHALLALAHRAPARASQLVPVFANHPSFFARTYAAQAAAAVFDTTTLYRLARDAHPNVRAEAVTGLQRVVGNAADSVYIAQLRLDDSQLLMAATAALDSTNRNTRAVPALLAALDRISAQKLETSRDGRVALLSALRRLGSAAHAERLRPYLNDFDPAVALLAAEMLQAWTGTRPPINVTTAPALALPTFAEAERMAAATYVVEMENGQSFDVRLFPFVAPTNAARFARLAERGYFNALTLHRIAVNFVVQGGSPNANEYAGDGAFSRDELGAPNWRGTVGLSTRGRDTGDGQIYINLIDNVRLDHDYTVYGEVVRGMEVVDALLEGAQIRRITTRVR